MKTKILITTSEDEITSVVANGNTEVYVQHMDASHRVGNPYQLKTVEVTNEQFGIIVKAPKVTAEQHNKFPKGRWATAALLFMLAMPCCAMPVLDAIAQTEGCSDTKRGLAGEVSRYQMLPSVFVSAAHLPLSAAMNPFTARNAANQVLRTRIAGFERCHGRKPTIFEQALLWHCPARVDKPTADDRDYAQRVVNLAVIP